MVAVEITVAIIGSIAAAATTAAATAATEIGANQSPGDRGATIENLTDVAFTCRASPIAHGSWKESPTAHINSAPTLDTLFDLWNTPPQRPAPRYSDYESLERSMDDHDDRNYDAAKDLGRQFSLWVKNQKLDLTDTIARTSVTRHGSGGVRACAVYYSEGADDDVALAIVYRHKAGSATNHAAAFMESREIMEKYLEGYPYSSAKSLKKRNVFFQKVIGKDPGPKLGPNESAGGMKSVNYKTIDNLYTYECSFAAADNCNFTLKKTKN